MHNFYKFSPLVLLLILRIFSFIAILPNWSDIGLYKIFAGNILAGQIPYFDFEVEYPPLTLILFLIPGTMAKITGNFEILYRLQMAIFDIGCLYMVGVMARDLFKADPRGIFAARIFYVILGSVAFQLIYDRFDLAVGFLIILSLYLALVKSAWRSAYIILWIAVLTKIFPIVLFPLYLVAQFKLSRSARKAASDFAVSLFVLAAVVIALQAMFGNWWEMVTAYHGERGIQIESIYSSIALIARSFGFPASVSRQFGAFEIANSFTSVMAIAALFLIVLSILALYIAFYFMMARPKDNVGRRQNLVKAVLVTLLAFIVFNKVLSPQYLIWLFPLVAFEASRGRWLTVIIFSLTAVATALLFPYNYVSLLKLETTGIILLNIRNLTLLIFGLLAVRDLLTG